MQKVEKVLLHLFYFGLLYLVMSSFTSHSLERFLKKISGGRLLATQEYVKYHHSLTHIEIGNRIDHGLRKAFDDPMVEPHLSFYTCYFYAL